MGGPRAAGLTKVPPFGWSKSWGPLQYADGYNLYSAYFILNEVDPLGTQKEGESGRPQGSYDVTTFHRDFFGPLEIAKCGEQAHARLSISAGFDWGFDGELTKAIKLKLGISAKAAYTTSRTFGLDKCTDGPCDGEVAKRIRVRVIYNRHTKMWYTWDEGYQGVLVFRPAGWERHWNRWYELVDIEAKLIDVWQKGSCSCKSGQATGKTAVNEEAVTGIEDEE